MDNQSEKSISSQSPKSGAETLRGASTPANEKTSREDNADEYPPIFIDSESKGSNRKTRFVMVSVFLSVFLVGLDRTIISTAIPQITNEFNSLTDVGWYGSAYLLTCCALQLLFGRIYTFFSIKGTFLTSVLLFEAASALCGAAPNSIAFIIGRAISGIGAAGIFAGTIVCVVYVIPLHHRPQVQGMMGAVMGVASIAGPLIGGGLTSNITWRWCFYLNLPIGAAAMIVIYLFLDIPNRDENNLPLTKKLKHLDAPGTLVLIPGVICLLLALQWGGQTYSWGNGRIVALLALAGILIIAFVAAQVLLPATATLPPRIFKQRSVVSGFWATICINSGNYVFIYFIPIWFQSIKGSSAAQSGIQTLPLMLSLVAGSIFGGAINGRIGYYTPLAIIGTCIMCCGAGLLTTFEGDTSAGKWIGYQILYGLGLGLCFQVPNLAVQTCLPKKDVPTGLALMLFGSLIGASVFVAVGENVLSNQLVQRLSSLPGFDPSLVASGGITSLLDSLPQSLRGTALEAYNEALRKVFMVGLILSCLTAIGTFSLEWKTVKKSQVAKAAAEEIGAAEENASGGKKVGTGNAAA
ncbi:hypothetical protein J7T55_000846 [Diaporthe amygdali]|uniref:uncharacterized protein n=1 Tax=Phomopsis amygdali TaxID=1214568 RepID=UPI0022FE35E5|nr:uncharacterized protein J7T55_000846 [Diaporthe amygdali]KAJ0119995.1 hypothetical protein J7T55_000846 [Diaporthe amygdali]